MNEAVSKARGYSIRIFLPDGSPTGIKQVTKSGWTGLGVVCPRPRIADAKGGDEFNKPGVYVLLGPSESADFPLAYIGEADPIGERLERHESKIDFWDVAYFFTTTDASLNKAHIQYIESSLLGIAKEARRCKLQNINSPTKPTLSAADIADAEAFLSEMLLCFPVLGVSIFTKPEAKPAGQNLFLLKNKGIHAEGYESKDGFVVKSKSTAVVEAVDSMHAYARALRLELIANGIFERAGNFFKLTQDYEFSSPSAASSILLGSSSNGRDAWRTSDGTSLKQIQELIGQKVLDQFRV